MITAFPDQRSKRKQPQPGAGQGGFVLVLIIVIILDSANEAPREYENDQENENDGLVTPRLPAMTAFTVQNESTLGAGRLTAVLRAASLAGLA